MLETYAATRYLVPLREGGSLPAVLDTDGGGLFVTKFRGAGQGARALVAEILVGALAAEAGLPIPEMALIELDESFGRTERDPEIRDILRASRGLNVGHRYLEGAFNFDPLADRVAPEPAARIVWLDALVTNIDRTARNPNLLRWQDAAGAPADPIWLIDHGAALYFHHDWGSVDEARARSPFPQIRDHVLLPYAEDLASADEELAARVDAAAVERALAAVPDTLLMDAPAGIVPAFATPQEHRRAYRDYFAQRLRTPRAFVEAAIAARAVLANADRRRLPYRR